MKTHYEIIHEIWNEGSESAKKKLSKHRVLIDSFTASCMKKLETELNDY